MNTKKTKERKLTLIQHQHVGLDEGDDSKGHARFLTTRQRVNLLRLHGARHTHGSQVGADQGLAGLRKKT